jgi:hypothetical protein
MNDEQQTMLTQALSMLNRTRTLVDLAYKESERVYENLQPEPVHDIFAIDNECGALNDIAVSIDSIAEEIEVILGYPPHPPKLSPSPDALPGRPRRGKPSLRIV